MTEIKDYQEYEQLFNDDLVVAVRNVLTVIEDNKHYEIEDTPEHNALKEYFNKFLLHTKISEERFIQKKSKT